MNIKLSTLTQVALLREGDIIKRFPSNCNDLPQDKFEEQRVDHIATFTVRSINIQNGVMGLVSTIVTTRMFASAGSVARLFIKPGDIIRENVWWV